MPNSIVPWESIASIEDVGEQLIASFRCGESSIDNWLQQTGKNAAARGECKVHVCLDGSGFPVAFFTLSSTSINPTEVSRSTRGGISGPIPAILLGKMAVRSDLQTCSGFGTHVLHHAMKYALESSRIVSARLLVVDALNEGLIPWYTKRGFVSIPGKQSRLICKMSNVASICSSKGDAYFVR